MFSNNLYVEVCVYIELSMIQLINLIFGIAGDIDSQFFVCFFVHRGGDDGEMGIAVLEIFDLCQSGGGDGVIHRGNGKGDEHLVGMESGIAVS